MSGIDPSGEIQELFLADQSEHSNVSLAGSTEYAALRQRDRARRESALILLESMENPDAQDIYRVAWLLNHGDTPEEACRAHQLAMQAVALDYSDAKWLAAASYDRWKMYNGEPQKYGTQIVPDGKRHRVWDTDPDTTDAERAEFGAPPLAAQHERALDLTNTQPQPPMDQAPDWLKAAMIRWGSE